MKYKVKWGDGYYNQKEEVVDEKFFSEENGYTKENINNIKRLLIRETIKLRDVNGDQWVGRISEKIEEGD